MLVLIVVLVLDAFDDEDDDDHENENEVTIGWRFTSLGVYHRYMNLVATLVI